MAKRVTTRVTTEENLTSDTIPEQTSAEPEIEDEATVELVKFFRSIGDAANRIKIFKVIAGERNYCGMAEPSLVSEDYVLQNYGPGKYILQALLDGAYVKGGQKTINLYEPPVTARSQAQAQAPVQPQAQAVSELSILQSQLARQQELLLELIRTQGGNKPEISITDIMSIMRDMQSMTKSVDMSAILPGVMSIFKDTMQLARETAGVSDGKGDWMSLIGKAMDKLPAIVGQIAGARFKPNNAAAAKDNGQFGQTVQEALQNGIAWLKKKALAGKEADLQVAVILDNFEDESYLVLGRTLLNMPFEDFGKIDPDILQEPLRSWFLRVYNGLKEGMQYVDANNEAIAGVDGSETDPKTNENVNGPGNTQSATKETS